MTIFENYFEKDGWTLKKINEDAKKHPKEFVNYIEKTFEKQLTNKFQCDMMYKLSVETARLNDFSRNVV